jgi:hypothetical protein
MNKEKLIKFVYILLRERLTFGDLEAILDEVESPNESATYALVQLYCEEIVNRLLKSGLKCYDNMCNTQEDDVKMVQVDGDGIAPNGQSYTFSTMPMCADCRKRNPQAVVVQN